MTGRGYYKLNAAGEVEPVLDTIEWAAWFETADRQVANTLIDDVRVSTIFLGLDHNFGSGKPILWETLVFGGPLNGEMFRYESRPEAVRGHEEMVMRVRGGGLGTRQIELED